MACLSCRPIAKCTVFASLPTSTTNSSSSSPQSNPDSKPPIPNAETRTKTLRRNGKVREKLERRVNLIKIERAIGAGSYRDSEPNSPIGRNSIFKGLLPNSDDLMEGSAERTLRETGEWLINKTEGGFRANGKKWLMFAFQWAIPVYIFLLLVASGVIKLPFTSPLLDDLMM